MRSIRAGLAAALVVVLSACTQAAAEPAQFDLSYSTGTIPPPGNYEYRLEGGFSTDALGISYLLRYRHREGMTEGELRRLGYSRDDDITWKGTLTGEQRTAWLELVRRTDVRQEDEPAAPGASSIRVTLRGADGSERTGVPANAGDWQRLADDIDRRARTELKHPRPQR